MEKRENLKESRRFIARRATAMSTIIMLAGWLMLTPLMAYAGDVRCTTREDPELQRWLTECSDGARAITRYDEAFKRYQTDIVRPPKGDQPPRGGPTPGKRPQ
jgi:hypothetical protein